MTIWNTTESHPMCLEDGIVPIVFSMWQKKGWSVEYGEHVMEAYLDFLNKKIEYYKLYRCHLFPPTPIHLLYREHQTPGMYNFENDMIEIFGEDKLEVLREPEYYSYSETRLKYAVITSHNWLAMNEDNLDGTIWSYHKMSGRGEYSADAIGLFVMSLTDLVPTGYAQAFVGESYRTVVERFLLLVGNSSMLPYVTVGFHEAWQMIRMRCRRRNEGIEAPYETNELTVGHRDSFFSLDAKWVKIHVKEGERHSTDGISIVFHRCTMSGWLKPHLDAFRAQAKWKPNVSLVFRANGIVISDFDSPYWLAVDPYSTLVIQGTWE